MFHAKILEKFDFYDTAISIKSSDVASMIKANRLVAQRCDYPIHIGVTEAGDEHSGSVKSAIGVGALLCDGIGDTLRVSLTADPLREIAAAKEILNALNIEGQRGMNIVSCPTCGRTKIDLISLSARFREAVSAEGLDDLPITVALMGCIVNGPGEAHEADIGIAGGIGEALLFAHGNTIGKIDEKDIIPTLIKEIKKIKEERFS
jgi:(E)-4-hydroxy-3-methylbut-2-enyl-diphosphate synthase